jgi:hypothetical protein
MPLNVSIKRTIALVNALAKLHNFCIDRGDVQVPRPCGVDELNLITHPLGHVPLEVQPGAGGQQVAVPTQLMDSGNHFDDMPRSSRYNARREAVAILPRTLLLQKVVDSHRVRPSCT